MQSAPRSDERPRRIEVNRILSDDGSSYVLLQDMSYGPGVGWYAQKTIRLDDVQVSALLRKLCCARQRPGDAARGSVRLDLPCLARDPSPASTPTEVAPETIVRLAEIIEFDGRR